MMNFIANEFVKRQTIDSRFSHFDGTWDQVVDMVRQNWDSRRSSYRDGVVIVTVPVDGFYSGVVLLGPGDELSGGFESRRPGESPRKFVVAAGRRKARAKSVDVILYSSCVLSEDNDNQLPPDEGNWEIISINASPTVGAMPIDPMVLMHNHFGSDGGTETGLSDHNFVSMLRESFLFWRDKVMHG